MSRRRLLGLPASGAASSAGQGRKPLLSAAAVRRLLDWFRREGKTYPWGEDITPYRVWVSEVMLQQTVAAGVIAFFNRWMERFPNLLCLAEAAEEEVLRYWEGLGYYSRGRNLLKAARLIRDEWGGHFPKDMGGWRALPGVGDYTARAVLSIACHQPYPVLDANVRRIGQRLLAIRGRPKGVDGELMAALEGCIPPEAPGTFNSALMQLGQQVCRAGTPNCPDCPLRGDCEAACQGLARLIPERQKQNITLLRSRRFLFFADEKVFLVRREGGIGQGLWILPGLPHPSGCPRGSGEGAAEDSPGYGGSLGDPRKITREQVKALDCILGEVDRQGLNRGILKERRHSYTRYRETLTVETILIPCGGALPELGGLSAAYTDGGWFSQKQTEDLPMPSVYRRILLEGWKTLA